MNPHLKTVLAIVTFPIWAPIIVVMWLYETAYILVNNDPREE